MAEEARIQFRLIRIDETRNNILHETKHNDLTSEKYKKTCKYLNYVENLLILVSTVTGCISISAFASLVCFTSSVVALNICAIISGIKKYKSVINKKKKKRMIKQCCQEKMS